MPRIFTTLVVLMLLLVLPGCMAGNVKVSQPVADSAAGIVIKVPSSCLPLMPCADRTLTFARLNDDGSILSDTLFRTAITRGDHYYLLNVEPGRYVAVASAYSRSMSSNADLGGGASLSTSRVFGENILFSEELVKQSEVEVTAGRLAVMGEFDFDIEGRMAFAPSAAAFMEDADAVQLHYARQIDPDMETRGATSAIKFFRGQFSNAEKGATTRRGLLAAASKHIGTAGWEAHIARSRQ